MALESMAGAKSISNLDRDKENVFSLQAPAELTESICGGGGGVGCG